MNEATTGGLLRAERGCRSSIDALLTPAHAARRAKPRDELSGTLDGVAPRPKAQAFETPQLRQLVEMRKDEVLALASRYRISNVRLFGSVARGDTGPSSDIDFLVDLPEDATLYDLAGFRRELAAILGVDVDVVSSRALLPRDRDVMEEATTL